MNTFIEQRVPAEGIINDSDLRTAVSAVSWGAIFAGATAAAAISLILLILGTGLGLSSISPWVHEGVSATTFGVSTIVWITFTQFMAFAIGGYIAGRLRAKWLDTPTDEVYFRDTAHGLLTWAVASLASAVLLTSVISSIIGGGINASASLVAGAVVGNEISKTDSVSTNDDGGSMAYFMDSLLRKDPNQIAAVETTDNNLVGSTNPKASLGEITRIFLHNANLKTLPAEDLRYAGQIVAQHTGLSQLDAEKRVTDTYANLQQNLRDAELMAKNAADKARKASMYAALWLFISLLIGAFVASLAATYGGRQRDA